MKTNPTWFGGVKCVCLPGLLMLIVGCAIAQNEAPLPAPTGPHKTGRTSIHWQDSARAELETSAPDDKRELMVHLFYPTDAKATDGQAVYVPDADAMRSLWNDASAPLAIQRAGTDQGVRFWDEGFPFSVQLRQVGRNEADRSE